MYILTGDDYIIDVKIEVNNEKIDEIISIIPDDKTIYKMFKSLIYDIKNTKSITSIQKLKSYKNSKRNGKIKEEKNEKDIIDNYGYLLREYIDNVSNAIKVVKNENSVEINAIELLKSFFNNDRPYNKKELEEKRKLYFEAINNTNILTNLNINNFSYSDKSKIIKKEVK